MLLVWIRPKIIPGSSIGYTFVSDSNGSVSVGTDIQESHGLQSQDGYYVFVHEQNGNVSIYFQNDRVWETIWSVTYDNFVNSIIPQAQSQGGSILIMQDDGNLVIYNGNPTFTPYNWFGVSALQVSGNSVWSSNTSNGIF